MLYLFLFALDYLIQLCNLGRSQLKLLLHLIRKHEIAYKFGGCTPMIIEDNSHVMDAHHPCILLVSAKRKRSTPSLRLRAQLIEHVSSAVFPLISF